MIEPGAGAAELRSAVDPWFEKHGVPHFNREYSSRKRVPTLMALLSTVLAFEIGLGPWIQLDATQLLLAPGILVVLALWVRPPLMAVSGLGPKEDHVWRSFLVRATGFILAAAYLLTRSEMPPGPWSDAWVDFGVALGGLLTFVVLFNDNVWRGGSAHLERRRRRLVGLIAGAVFVFACEGSLIAPFQVGMNSVAGSVAPGLLPVPQALPALVIVWIIFFYVLRLARAAGPGDAPAQPPPEPEAERGSPGLDMAMFVPSVPLAMLVFSGETVVLPHALAEGWEQAVPPLALLLVLAATAWRPWQAPSCLTDTAQAKQWVTQRLRYPILLYLFSYPILVAVFFGVDAFGRHLTGLAAFGLTLAIQALYVAVGWFIVGFGLDRVALWAGGGARANLRSVVTALARGLPLLLLFSGVLVFTAEIWEVAVEMSTVAFIGLVALLLALTASLVLITSLHELAEHCQFASRSAVCAGAVGTGAEPPPPEPFATELEDFARSTSEKKFTLDLRGNQKVNALAVLSLYQGLVFLPVLLASAGLLLAIGHIAVPVDVAAEWIYGDGPHPVRAPLLAEREFLDEPWTRVAVLLSIFSLLYLAASVLSDPDRRLAFFEGADSAIRQRLAVALVYGRVVHGDDARTAREPIGRRRARRAARAPATSP